MRENEPLRGFEATIKLFGKYADNAEKYAHQAAEDAVMMVARRSQYYCPESSPEEYEKRMKRPNEDLRHLRDTMQVHSDRLCHFQITYDAWYAVYVHEMTDYTHEAPTQAKFLEQAVKDMYPMLTEAIGKQFYAEMSAFGTGGPNDWVQPRQFSEGNE